MQKIKNNSQNSSRESLLKCIFRGMEKNEVFLYKNTRDTYEEVIELISDSIDYIRALDKDNYANRAITFFLCHVFMPQSYAMHIDLLSGNLPICFSELRLMVESLAKSFYADYKYPEDIFFQDKFEKLERNLKASKVSITKLIKNIEGLTGIKGEFVDLWRKLSHDWVHAEGLVNRVVDCIANRESVPPWGLVLPMQYTTGDLPELIELSRDIKSFRKVVATVIEKI